MTTIAVIDYGMGNLRSVCKAIEHVAPEADVQLVTSAESLRRADRVVFPGQGAIPGCVVALDRSGMREALVQSMHAKPFLGICLGLQALYESSEEGGGTACLDQLPGMVRRFDARATGASRGLKIPHMGWNRVHQERAHPLWRGIAQDARFYFVHSYYADTADPKLIAGSTSYGVRFTSAAARENIFAVQFHPEKSQRAGLQLLANFVGWDGQA
jgi:imidazole glycerol-phosphate synthase subunit HisH